LQRAFIAAGGKWSTFVIWTKHTFTLGRADYQRQFEPILYGWPAGRERYWCGARDQGDVWFIDKPARNDLHPTMKPVALVERAIQNSSKSRDLVLDPFGGSGSTLISCEKAGHQARLIELDSKYCDVIVQRWQNWAGAIAVLEEDGRSFGEIAGEAVRGRTGGADQCVSLRSGESRRIDRPYAELPYQAGPDRGASVALLTGLPRLRTVLVPRRHGDAQGIAAVIAAAAANEASARDRATWCTAAGRAAAA
jgi:DNA methylase